MTVRELFDFITEPNINDSNIDAYLQEAQKKAESRLFEERTAEDAVNEEVFKQSYIPQRLDQVIDYERDLKAAKSEGGKDTVLYRTILGLNNELTGAQKVSLKKRKFISCSLEPLFCPLRGLLSFMKRWSGRNNLWDFP